MGERAGVIIAVMSSGFGGTAAAVTRYLVGNADPVTLAILRWGIAFPCVLPIALLLKAKWPRRADWASVAALGFCFFGLFFVLYNTALGYTTAARASLALSTLPLQTMLVGALLGVEPLGTRKSVGVGIAMLGVFAALASDIADAPTDAWRGELIMAGAVLCMAFYNVRSRPFIERSSALGFLTVGMGSGALALVLFGVSSGRAAVVGSFGASQWIAGIYLGVAGGALAFILWVLALERATPTRVANTMTVNPIAAALLATQLVGEPIRLTLVFGLLAVLSGIWIATTEGHKVRRNPLASRDIRIGQPADPRPAEKPERTEQVQRTGAVLGDRIGNADRLHAILDALMRSVKPTLLWTERVRGQRLPPNLNDQALRDLGIDRATADPESTATVWRRDCAQVW